MISYKPFWDILKEKNISTYWLIKHKNISSSTIDRLRTGKPITTTTINDLCLVLNCNVQDIIIFLEEKIAE